MKREYGGPGGTNIAVEMTAVMLIMIIIKKKTYGQVDKVKRTFW